MGKQKQDGKKGTKRPADQRPKKGLRAIKTNQKNTRGRETHPEKRRTGHTAETGGQQKGKRQRHNKKQIKGWRPNERAGGSVTCLPDLCLFEKEKKKHERNRDKTNTKQNGDDKTDEKNNKKNGPDK